MTEEIKKQILQLGILKDNILFDEPMSKHTTFKVGGPAECYIKIDDIQDLRHILRFAKQNEIPITILGNGSNVLVLDGGIKGIVLNIRFNKIEMMNLDKKIFANVGAGVKISVFGHLLLKNAITGFEELSGIPGTIGGAVRMNAGAHGKEFKDIVSTVVCMDESPKQLFGEVREPVPMKPGYVRKIDDEYERKGVAELLLAVEPLTGYLRVDVLARRTKQDWAHFIKALVDDEYPNCEKLILVMDNLNTHRIGSLYETFQAEQAHRIAQKIEIHYM